MAGAKELLKFSDRVHILYVEDDERLRKDTLRLLSTFFNRITVAENGKVALDVYQPGKFDIIISDYIMPEVNGMELTKQIKAINSNQFIIILSAHDEGHHVEQLRKAGVDDFIFKPLNIQQFIATMHKSCSLLKQPDLQSACCRIRSLSSVP